MKYLFDNKQKYEAAKANKRVSTNNNSNSKNHAHIEVKLMGRA